LLWHTCMILWTGALDGWCPEVRHSRAIHTRHFRFTRYTVHTLHLPCAALVSTAQTGAISSAHAPWRYKPRSMNTALYLLQPPAQIQRRTQFLTAVAFSATGIQRMRKMIGGHLHPSAPPPSALLPSHLMPPPLAPVTPVTYVVPTAAAAAAAAAAVAAVQRPCT
jgi:hypothetical protein